MSCCKKTDCNNVKLPKEEITGLSGLPAAIFTGLVNVVRTGKITEVFKNAAADKLAVMIAELVNENQYLKTVLQTPVPKTTVAADMFKISFGPTQNYELAIPLLTVEKQQELLANLQAAVVQLEQQTKSETAKQLELFDSLK